MSGFKRFATAADFFVMPPNNRAENAFNGPSCQINASGQSLAFKKRARIVQALYCALAIVCFTQVRRHRFRFCHKD
jgi:hypothetical protein